MRKLLIPLIVLSSLYFAGCSKKSTEPTPPPTPAPRLIVDTVSVAPNMDSVDAPVWNLVDSVLVEIGGEQSTYGFDPDIGKINVTMKAIKKGGVLYICAKWKDNNADLWGSYIRKTSYSNEWEHVVSEGEDKFSIMFDGGDNGTEKANCATMCHVDNMRPTGGGHVDVWNWKSSSTNPAKLADDGWWSNISGQAFDATWPNMDAYYSNWASGYAMPASMHKDDTAFHNSVLFRTDAVGFDYNRHWQTGDSMPGYVIDSTVYDSPTRSNSSRWDVRTISRFDNISTPRTWMVVFERTLYTGNPDDADLSTPDSVQVTIAASNGQVPYQLPDLIYDWQHSGSKPFYIILKP